MSAMKRLPTEDFDRDVTSVAMDERFVLVGQVNKSDIYHGDDVDIANIDEHNMLTIIVHCPGQRQTGCGLPEERQHRLQHQDLRQRHHRGVL